MVNQEYMWGGITLDLSFPVDPVANENMVLIKKIINTTTNIRAPHEPVKEIGRLLPNISLK